MSKTKQIDEEFSDEEAASRRDEITKALIKMPPQPHAPKVKKHSKRELHGAAKAGHKPPNVTGKTKK